MPSKSMIAASSAAAAHTANAVDQAKLVLAERYKTKPCRNFNPATGICPYEGRCMFAHGEHELRSLEMNLRDGLVTEEAIKAFQRIIRTRGQRAAKAAAAAIININPGKGNKARLLAACGSLSTSACSPVVTLAATPCVSAMLSPLVEVAWQRSGAGINIAGSSAHRSDAQGAFRNLGLMLPTVKLSLDSAPSQPLGPGLLSDNDEFDDNADDANVSVCSVLPNDPLVLMCTPQEPALIALANDSITSSGAAAASAAPAAAFSARSSTAGAPRDAGTSRSLGCGSVLTSPNASSCFRPVAPSPAKAMVGMNQYRFEPYARYQSYEP